ncbi:hypothetical protein [Saccharothrix texasensis]|uniref:hypothetical protein n=1 Tax=Saccharothrix texasensis TaxID=103734 RepID=UPI0014770A28|nr:hypothetical protein [Saccharothrix texasensis]
MQHWKHVATHRAQPLCAATGHSGVVRSGWADHYCVFNEECAAWDLHVRSAPG